MLTLTKLSETSTKITLGWAPVPGCLGYAFYADGARISNTWDPNKSQITFSKGPAQFKVVALGNKEEGVYPFGPPVSTWPPVPVVAPPFTPTRIVSVTSSAQFASALAALAPGDKLNCNGFTVTGQVSILHQLSGPAEIHFTNVNFVGDNPQLNAVWVRAKNVRLFGGNLSNPLGHGLLFHQCTNVLWHGFRVAGVGGTCLRVFTTSDFPGNTSGLDLFGEVTDDGRNLSIDPHAEKGTGLHPSYIGGVTATTQAQQVTNSRFIIDAHDCATGSNQMGPRITGCDHYYRAKNLTFVAKSQTAGNAVQLFGGAGVGDLDIWVEADNVAQVSRVTTEPFGPIRFIHGRGVNVRGNYDSQVKYMPNPAITYTDCT